jgi:5-methylcytosine-specific restriction endonuclease McrA
MRVCRGVPGEPCTKLIPHADYYCANCKRKDNARRSLKAGKAGLKTRYWREVRLARLQLDGYRCVLRHDGCTGYAETVHLARELNGNHLLATTENTRSACRHCHGVTDAPRSHY